MELNEKVGNWLSNLKLFALNSEIHCSREEKSIGKTLIGTRNVNLALNEMIKYMHYDLGFSYENVVDQPIIIPDGKQILLFTVGNNGYYTDISIIHELMVYPVKNYKQFIINNNSPMIGIINWHEGLVPLINTKALLEEKDVHDNYAIICDIGKELYAFTINTVFAKYEIENSEYTNEIEINNTKFKYINFNTFNYELIETRMKMEI